jgi:hypothetical protein
MQHTNTFPENIWIQHIIKYFGPFYMDQLLYHTHILNIYVLAGFSNTYLWYSIYQAELQLNIVMGYNIY